MTETLVLVFVYTVVCPLVFVGGFKLMYWLLERRDHRYEEDEAA